MNNLQKIRFADGERGWAQIFQPATGPGLMARVANIPYSGDANMQDIVLLDPPADGDGIHTIKSIVAKWYDAKTCLRYDRVEEFDLLVNLLVSAGCVTEGGIEPSTGSRGMLAVAYFADVNPIEIAESIGIDQPEAREAAL